MIKNHEILLSYHHDVRNTSQAMSTINFLDLVEKIKSGENNLDHQIKLLRKVQSYSKERYRTMKTQLPYFSMSIFADGKRHYDHFISANGLIIDIDAETHLDPSLLQKIKSDERIKRLFTSPKG